MNILRLLKRIHLYGTWKRTCLFLINHVFIGLRPFSRKAKCILLRSIECPIGSNTTIVGPIYPIASIEIGDNCWIGKNLIVNGNGRVVIGDNCDIAPEVTFNTGGHKIGDGDRRAGKGEIYTIEVGRGTWIGARSTIIGNTDIGKGCVVAACACVTKDVPDNTLVGGVPARIIRSLSDEYSESVTQ